VVSELFSMVVAVEEAQLDYFAPDIALLLTPERPAVERAVVERRREFVAGRLLARRAMHRLGHPIVPIPAGADGAPVWPAGLTGSITHARTWCAVALARRTSVRTVGIDVEEEEPLAPELWPTVCTDREFGWLYSLPAKRRGLAAKLMFSAKESAYKALYQITRRFLDFSAMSIDFAKDGSWQATLRVTCGDEFAKGHRIRGRWRVSMGLIATAATLPRNSSDVTKAEP
jgi:4'-phosphopantetheinyl transferase EntD